MKNGITNRQMFFLLLLTITASSSSGVAQSIAQTAGRTGWIPILAQSVLFGVAAVIITKLNSMHPGKALFDYGRDITGRGVIIVITVYYIVYFILIGVYLHQAISKLIVSNFLKHTPEFALLLMSIPILAYATSKGITNVARMAEIIGVFFLIVVVLLCVSMMTQGYNDHILPFFSSADVKAFLPAMKELIIPFGGLAILLVIPFSSQNTKVPRVALMTMLAIGIYYVAITESVIKVLGINNTMAYNDAFIEAIRVTNIPVLERPDLVYLVFGLTGLFGEMIVIYTAINEHLCKLVPPKTKRFVVLIVLGAVLFVLTLLSMLIRDFDNVFDNFFPYLEILSAFAIPSLLLILAKAKAARAKKQAA